MTYLNNITWHTQSVNTQDRVIKNGHKSAILWFTGLSGSGKSTIANAVVAILHNMNCQSYILDGDNIRLGLNADLSFSAADRSENIRRISEVGKLFVDAGMLVCAAFISPYKKDRREVRNKFNQDSFIEVFVDCDIDECTKRDPKGLYKKARGGEIKNFTGISAPYEKPTKAEIIVNSAKLNVAECTQIIINYLIEKKYINSGD